MSIELSSRLPADRAPGSWGWIVTAVPRASAATSTRSKRLGSTADAGLGPCELAGPGTATVARRAMSATLATTFLCRTSGPDRTTDRPIRPISAPFVTKSESCQHRPDAISDLSTSRPAGPSAHARAALARVVRPHDPVRAGTCLAHDADRRWTGHGRPQPRRRRGARRGVRPRRGPGAGRGPRPARARRRRRPDPDRPPAHRTPGQALPGRPDPADGRGAGVPRAGDPRAEGHRPGGASRAGRA